MRMNGMRCFAVAMLAAIGLTLSASAEKWTMMGPTGIGLSFGTLGNQDYAPYANYVAYLFKDSGNTAHTTIKAKLENNTFSLSDLNRMVDGGYVLANNIMYYGFIEMPKEGAAKLTVEAGVKYYAIVFNTAVVLDATSEQQRQYAIMESSVLGTAKVNGDRLELCGEHLTAPAATTILATGAAPGTVTYSAVVLTDTPWANIVWQGSDGQQKTVLPTNAVATLSVTNATVSFSATSPVTLGTLVVKASNSAFAVTGLPDTGLTWQKTVLTATVEGREGLQVTANAEGYTTHELFSDTGLAVVGVEAGKQLININCGGAYSGNVQTGNNNVGSVTGEILYGLTGYQARGSQWNNFINTANSNFALKDALGVPVAAKLTTSAANTYTLPGSSGTLATTRNDTWFNNAGLFYSYLDDGGSLARYTVTGLPTMDGLQPLQYTVVVYFSTDDNATAYTSLKVNDTYYTGSGSTTVVGDVPWGTPSYTRGAGTTAIAAQEGVNCLVVRDIPATATLVVTTGARIIADNTPHRRGGLAAVQILIEPSDAVITTATVENSLNWEGLTWTPAVTSWNNATNVTAIITNAQENATVTAPTGMSVDSVYVRNPTSLTLTLNGAQMNVLDTQDSTGTTVLEGSTGAAAVKVGGTTQLTVSGTGALTVANGATAILTDGVAMGAYDNKGTIVVEGPRMALLPGLTTGAAAYTDLTIASGAVNFAGRLLVRANDQIAFTGTSAALGGVIQMSGGTVSAEPVLAFAAGTTLNQQGGTVTASGVKNDGALTYTLSGGSLELGAEGAKGATPTFKLAGGTLKATETAVFDWPVTLMATSTVEVVSGADLAAPRAITGTGMLVKSGAGTLNVSSFGGKNTLALTAGMVDIGTNQTSVAALEVQDNAALKFTLATTAVDSSLLTTSNGVTIAAGKTLTISAVLPTEGNRFSPTYCVVRGAVTMGAGAKVELGSAPLVEGITNVLVTADEDGIYVSIQGPNVGDYTYPLSATATEKVQDWTALPWRDAGGRVVAADYDWSMPDGLELTFAEGADATVRMDVSVTVTNMPFVIRGAGSGTLIQEPNAVFATTIDCSDATGHVNIEMSIGNANVIAGADTRLARSGAGTLTIGTGKKATIMEPWPGVISNQGELVYAGTHAYGGMTLNEANTVTFAGAIDLADRLTVNTGTMRVTDGTLTVRQLYTDMVEGSTTPIIAKIEQDGGTIKVNGVVDPSVTNVVFGMIRDASGATGDRTTYTLNDGVFDAEDQIVIVGPAARTTITMNGGVLKAATLQSGTPDTGNLNLMNGVVEVRDRIAFPNSGDDRSGENIPFIGISSALRIGTGTLRAMGDLVIGQATLLTDANTGAAIDVNGHAVTAEYEFKGVGGLRILDTSAQGGGSMTLAGENRYQGGTSVSNAVLKVTGALTGSTGYQVDAGGRLELSGSMPINSTITVVSNGVFDVACTQDIATVNVAAGGMLNLHAKTVMRAMSGTLAAGATIQTYICAGQQGSLQIYQPQSLDGLIIRVAAEPGSYIPLNAEVGPIVTILSGSFTGDISNIELDVPQDDSVWTAELRTNGSSQSIWLKRKGFFTLRVR